MCQLLGPSCCLRTLDVSGNAFTNVGVAMLVNQLQVMMLVMIKIIAAAAAAASSTTCCTITITITISMTITPPLQRSPLMAALDLSKNATDAGVTCDV